MITRRIVLMIRKNNLRQAEWSGGKAREGSVRTDEGTTMQDRNIVSNLLIYIVISLAWGMSAANCAAAPTAGFLANGNSRRKPPSQVSVSISPKNPSIISGGAQQFTATVTGSSNTAVSWSATAGAISDRKSTRLNSSHRCISY